LADLGEQVFQMGVIAERGQGAAVVIR
jgi:hypothetical protein